MFKSGQPNPYDDLVAKTTDENLTSENWELIITLCDKVTDEGEQGARNVIASLLKRLSHRNPNVQLYTLSLAESLSKNCGLELHREIASRSFTQGLEKIVTDRTTHDKVKRKALVLIATWTHEFESNPSLGIMEECYNTLKAKNYKFEAPVEAPPPQVDDEIRRKEEEELQRVLEMSMHDKGGRGGWNPYEGSSAGPSGSGSTSTATLPQVPQAPAHPTVHPPSSAPPPGKKSPTRITTHPYGAPHYPSGYTPGPARAASPPKSASPVASPSPASSKTSLPVAGSSATSTRVRALHNFEPTEPGELPFEKGDIIKVVDRNYKDWWRGQLKGRTGIFPVNYVEILPEPTPAEIAKEAEQEAAIFSEATNIDKLLGMLRGLDPAKDNLADNEEIQELYRSSMSLRPKIVKLIDKYSQKRAELVAMNESFIKARTIFDRLMEDSLARHTGLYDGRLPYQPHRQGSGPRSDFRGPGYPSYDSPGGFAFPRPAPTPAGPFPPGQGMEGLYIKTPAPVGPQPYGDPNAQGPVQQGYPQGVPNQQGPVPYGGIPNQAGGMAPPNYQSPPPQQLQQVPLQQQTQLQGQPQLQAPQPQQPPMQQQAQVSTVQHNAQQFSPQPQQQPEQVPQQQQQQPQQKRTITEGPPYVFDPEASYPDQNAQAWAQYYANGGTDLTGAVYFISVPGLTDKQPQQAPQPAEQNLQPQQQMQPGPGQGPVDQMQPNQSAVGGPGGGANLEHRRSLSATYKMNLQPNPSSPIVPANTSPTAAAFGAPQQDAPPLSPGGQQRPQSYFSPSPGMNPGGVPGGVPHTQGVAEQAAVNNLPNGHTSPMVTAPYHQFHQLNGQFSAMGISDQQTSPPGVQQTAGLA